MTRRRKQIQSHTLTVARNLPELRAKHRRDSTWSTDRTTNPTATKTSQNHVTALAQSYRRRVSGIMSSNTSSPWVAMIRRKPTAITITHEDIADFEARRLQKQREKEKQENQAPDAKGSGAATSTKDGANAGASVAVDPSDELKPLLGDKARIVRSREERIGIGRRG